MFMRGIYLLICNKKIVFVETFKKFPLFMISYNLNYQLKNEYEKNNEH